MQTLKDSCNLQHVSLDFNPASRMLMAYIKTARVEHASLSRSILPGRVVDYAVALKLDSIIGHAWHRLRPLSGVSINSWNHTTRARRNPIAIILETKGPMKSWTDGKTQVTIWMRPC